MRMKLTVKQIRNLHLSDTKTEKTIDNHLQAKYIARPVSYRLAWLFIRLGVTANAITVLTLLVVIVGGMCIGFGTYTSVVLGAIIMTIGYVLDYVDGTVARATNTITNLGRYLDRTCDEVVETIIPISVGVGLYVSDCAFLGMSPLFYLILGFSYAIVHLLSTLSALHIRITYNVIPHEFYSSERLDAWQLIYKIGINVKSSTVLILLVLVFIPHGLSIFLIGFALLTVCELIMGVYKVMVNR
jgi:phosphatidylglycerophosphate synthase